VDEEHVVRCRSEEFDDVASDRRLFVTAVDEGEAAREVDREVEEDLLVR
jgi:hypothetical protein